MEVEKPGSEIDQYLQQRIASLNEGADTAEKRQFGTLSLTYRTQSNTLSGVAIGMDIIRQNMDPDTVRLLIDAMGPEPRQTVIAYKQDRFVQFRLKGLAGAIRGLVGGNR